MGEHYKSLKRPRALFNTLRWSLSPCRFGWSTTSVFSYAPRGADSPERHPNSRGRATASRPPCTAALGVLGERRGAAAHLCERRVMKVAPLRMTLLAPQDGDRSLGNEGFFFIFGCVPSQEFLFLVPVFGFSFIRKTFFCGDRTLSSPPGGFFSLRRLFFWRCGRALNSVGPSPCKPKSTILALSFDAAQ